MKDVNLGRQVIAVLIAITAILHLSSAYLPIKIVYYLGKYDGFALLLILLGCVFVVINLVAAYGLFFMRRWGYTAAYVAIVYSSLIFFVSYIPFFDYLFPKKYAEYANVLANIGIVALLISMQMSEFKPKLKPRAKPSKQKRKK